MIPKCNIPKCNIPKKNIPKCNTSGLEHNTKDIIIERSSLLVNNPTDSLIKDFEEEQNFESDNSETRSENELV